MIYIVVGTQKFQFNRLLKQIDEFVVDGTIRDIVFAQVGYSDYKPVHYKYTDFLGKEEFNAHIEKCDLLITHSGVGTIMAGLKNSKPVIAVPRLAKYEEHVDDHQVQIANSFAIKNYILICNETCNLGKLISEAKVHKFDKYISQKDNAIKTIREYICSI